MTDHPSSSPHLVRLGTDAGDKVEPDYVVKGEIDILNATAFRKGLIEAVSKSATEQVLVDCRLMEFIDSMGISALVESRRQALASGRKIVLVDPPERVRRVLDLCGLASAFPVVET